METVKKVKILKITDRSVEEKLDTIAVEKPLNIFVNFEFYAALMCTPTELMELAAGFLFSEGVISSSGDIESIEEKYGDSVHVVLNHELRKDSKRHFKLAENAAEFTAESILRNMGQFVNMSEVFRETGGVHSCAICGGGGIEIFSEDIGRRNALDKVIGKALLKGIDMKKKFILTSGRLFSDIVVKAAAAGVPMLVSHSAPTDLALETAEAANITLLGFVRGNRMNVYCGSQRIIR